MKKGIDYIGVAIVPFAHDGEGNYVVGLRGEACRDEQNCWEPIGGGALKFGESIEQGVTREVAEELGVIPFNLEFLGTREVFREIDGRQSHWLAFDYRTQVDRAAVQIMKPDKCTDLQWVKPNAVPLPQHSQFSIFLDTYQDKLV